MQDVFTYAASAGNGGTDTATLSTNVSGSNDAPMIDAARSELANGPRSVIIDFDSGTYPEGPDGREYFQNGFVISNFSKRGVIAADQDGAGDREDGTYIFVQGD